MDLIKPPIEITPSLLTAEIYRSVLESFILREGTDYGVHEISLEKKIENLKAQVDKGEIVLAFDPNTESITFLSKNEWKKIVK